MNPIEMTQSLSERLHNYLRYALPVEKAMPEYTAKLDDFFKNNQFADEPFLEWMPIYENATENGKMLTLQQLVSQDIILQETADIFAQYFGTTPDKTVLYAHQYEALRAYRKNSNIIITTGTGSGKTESFLIPVIDKIIRLKKEHPHLPGIKAMILYPMNALVNDQLLRLRKLLTNAKASDGTPLITFGKYTGELESIHTEKEYEDISSAEKRKFQKLNHGNFEISPFEDSIPIPGEMTKRSEWHENPADIMITNYSMLEFLLLKPETQKIFLSQWSFIVLDEAHCYTGGLGTELAWLLRRVKRRLNNPPELRLIATSATLLNDKSLSEQESKEFIIENFGKKLFRSTAPYEVIFSSYASCYMKGTTKSPEYTDYYRIINSPFAIKNFSDIINSEVPELSLAQVSQELLGLEGRAKKLSSITKIISRIIENHGTCSVGEMITVWKTYSALKNNTFFFDKSLFDVELGLENTQGNWAVIEWLLEYCSKMVNASYDENDKDVRDQWRNLLHEPTDPTEAYDNERKGNRLYLLKKYNKLEFGKRLDDVDYEALYWLAKTAFFFDQQTPTRLGVLACHLSFRHESLSYFQQFIVAANDLTLRIKELRKAVSFAWTQALGSQTSNDQFEVLISDFMCGNSHFNAIIEHFKKFQESKDKCTTGLFPQQFSAVASAVFKQPFSQDLAEKFDAFIQLTSLGEIEQYKKPLLTIRYHQLMSGINSVGITFKKNTQAKDFSLVAGTTQQMDDRQVFTLGVCPDCGQPFVLGYLADQTIPKGQNVSLFRIRGEKSHFLHAFAIQQGAALFETEKDYRTIKNTPSPIWEDCSLYIDLQKAVVGGKPEKMQEPVRVIWHIPPRADDSQGDEFLPICPHCKSVKARRQNRRYGAIIPYAASRQDLKLVALDHLLFMTAASKDPITSQLPGSGRKVLTFSDTRSGAAQLAYQYQSYSRKRMLSYLLTFALQDLEEKSCLTDSEKEDDDFCIDLYNLEFWDDPELFLNYFHAQSPRNILFVAGALLIESRKRNAARLFDIPIPGVNGNSKDSYSAIFLLVDIIRENNTRALLSTNVVTLKSKALEQYDFTKLNDALSKLGCRALPSKEKLKDLCYFIFFYLLRHCKLTIAKRGFDWLEKAFLGYDDNELPSCSADKIVNSTAIKHETQLLFPQTSQQDIVAILKTIWRQVFQNLQTSTLKRSLSAKNTATIIDGKSNALNLLDLYFEKGDVVQTTDDVKPYERETDFILRNGNIPARIEEHTAQIDKQVAASYQNAFSEGQINILSCSTTFEMGVDLGELGSVFLSNMPPGVANYRQRAGRAGRRPGMSAYVLTFIGDNSHDQYYKEHAPELLFGDVACPSIYLESPVFRARHLRSEAFHHFLMQYANSPVIMKNIKNGEETEKSLKWDQVSDFFIGARTSRKKLFCKFSPLIDNLKGWFENEQKNGSLQKYISDLDDTESLDYSVAADFCWQMSDQCNIEHDNIITPYPLVPTEETIQKFRNLGGNHRPELKAGKIFIEQENMHRSALQRKLMQIATAYNNEKDIFDPNNTLDGAASHLFYESVITWLARNRILPKYGFPVDVTQLMIENDTALNLERDMRLGLFEYSPGQKLIADKRVYESTEAIAWKKGVHDPNNALHESYYVTFYECPYCHDLSLDNSKCPQGHPRFPKSVFKPDGFRGRRVFAAEQLARPYIPRVQLYTGGIRNESVVNLPNSIMKVAESDTDLLQYINKGHDIRNSGFEISAGFKTRCWLMHEVCTDMAIWFFPQISGIDESAKESALQAILHAAALVLKIEPRDIGGTIQTLGNQTAFILFDASAGGGGIVQELILHSNEPEVKKSRADIIKKILEKAIEICRTCPECEKTMPFREDAKFITGEQFNVKYGTPIGQCDFAEKTPKEQKSYRLRQACYHCLYSYSNQNKHELLDRAQAVMLLEKLLPQN